MTAARNSVAESFEDDLLAELFQFADGGSSKLRHSATLPDSWVARCSALIEQSGVAQQIADWRGQDRKTSGPGGRPASLNDHTVLVLLTILAFEHSPLMVTRMTELLCHRLSEKAKQTLGIAIAPASDQDWYDRLWRATRSLLKVIDPFPGPRHRQLTRQEFSTVKASRDPVETAEKQKRLDEVCNQLVEVSLCMVPREVRRRWRGNACIDATLVPAFGKRGTVKRSDYVSIEPDAAWYVREGDHREVTAEGRRAPKKVMWGWEATFAVQATNDPARVPDFPLLVAGIAFGKPGHDVSGHAIKTFQSIIERGHPAGYAVADRAYFPNSRAELLQLPMRALGYGLVFDYQSDQLGVSDSHAGSIQVEGDWYCPSMPQPLIDATIDYRNAKTIDEATWRQRIEQRGQYALRRKERPDSDGHVPMRCPAAGPSATVSCPLKPLTQDKQGSTRIFITPTHPDRICTNTASVSFPPSAGAKWAQALRYGSPEWQATYSTARNTVEGYNGYIKDSSREALSDSSRRRIRGYAAQYLLVTFLVLAANARKIAAFYDAERKAADTTVAGVKRSRPRRRDRLADFTTPAADTVPDDPPAA
ncbi:MAG: hypothetical protein M3Y42_00640 [Actinomycetota bacterium]|nr:hypothetical protein [Actinomycetota bacterium]MDQ2955458.1 hypothetical protein [Actinomycetota bacterium]